MSFPTRRTFLQTAVAAAASLFPPGGVRAGGTSGFWSLHTPTGESWAVGDPVAWSLENAGQPVLERARERLVTLTAADPQRVIRLVVRRCRLNSRSPTTNNTSPTATWRTSWTRADRSGFSTVFAGPRVGRRLWAAEGRQGNRSRRVCRPSAGHKDTPENPREISIEDRGCPETPGVGHRGPTVALGPPVWGWVALGRPARSGRGKTQLMRLGGVLLDTHIPHPSARVGGDKIASLRHPW
jgi:hypothetical protein